MDLEHDPAEEPEHDLGLIAGMLILIPPPCMTLALTMEHGQDGCTWRYE